METRPRLREVRKVENKKEVHSMTVYVHPDVLDHGLEYLMANAEWQIACEGAPASYAEATTAPASGKALAAVAMSSADFTIVDTDDGGRAVSWKTKIRVLVSANGTVDHVVFVSSTDSKLLMVREAISGVPLGGAGVRTVTLRGSRFLFPMPELV